MASVGGTESLGITAGETKNPSKNMPKVVKLVFWRYKSVESVILPHLILPFRIMIFYILTILVIGLNGKPFPSFLTHLTSLLVPWDYPNLSNNSTTTSPFTIVFKLAGSCEITHLASFLGKLTRATQPPRLR